VAKHPWRVIICYGLLPRSEPEPAVPATEEIDVISGSMMKILKTGYDLFSRQSNFGWREEQANHPNTVGASIWISVLEGAS
jgi:hypothetical protein